MKTVDVLAESRVTHIGSGKVDKKKGRWVGRKRRSTCKAHLPDYQFNLTIPEFTLYHPDLQIYRSISTYSEGPPEAPSIPPLLVAFILDTSDVPNGQALIWNRPGGKVTIDTSLFGDKGKGNAQRTGIVLERWTLRAR
jgi:autophagy-related protein 13